MTRIALTTEQSKLLLHHRLCPGDSSFNLALVYRICGPVDLDRLRDSILRVLRTNPALNTTFVEDGAGGSAIHNPGQEPSVPVIAAPFPAIPSGSDNPSVSDAQAEADLVAGLLGAQADQPLPPDTWPLYAVTIYSGQFASYLGIIASHLISDAITLFTFAEMVSELYRTGELSGDLARGIGDEPARLARTDVSPEVAAARRESGVAAFRQVLAGVDRLDHDAFVQPREPGGVLPGVREQWEVPDDLVAAVRASELVRRWGAFTVFLAAYTVVLGALTGRRRVVAGLPVATRSGRRSLYSLGYFISTLPLAADLDPELTFADLCEALAGRVTLMLRHKTFDLTADATEVFGRRPAGPLQLDNVVTYYRKAFPLELPDCAVDSLFVPRRQVRYPLAVNVQDNGDGYLVGVEYIDRLAPADPRACLEHVLRLALADPQGALGGIGVLGAERTATIDRLVNPGRSYPVASSLTVRLAEVAAAQPDREAVRDTAGTSWTYAELDAAVSRVAAAVAASGAGEHVAVAMRRRKELVATILGILRSGRQYVPLDPSAPATRIAYITGQFSDLCLIADPDLLADVEVARRLDPAALASPSTVDEPGTVDVVDRRPDDGAYIIFTSGSTGVPKGVDVSHRNVLRLIASGDDHYDFGPDDVWCLFHSYAFDVSVWELFGSLLHGGVLVVPDEQVVRDPAAFAELLCAHGVTVLNQTPSAFRRLTAGLDVGLAARLAVRWVVFAGEMLDTAILRPWVDLMGDRARLANMYGITETTVHSTFFEVEPATVYHSGPSVIGRPLGDLTIHVVDGELRPCPLGVAGEILVGGPGVARGYFGRPDLTAQRFRPDTPYGEVVYRSGDRAYVRPDGQLVYLDRIDRQVQLRGYRVEPGEVESALRGAPGVKEAYVALHATGGGEPRLIAWVIASDDCDEPALRAALRDRLPAYMVPSVFVRVAELPLNVNGKVAKELLPPPPAPAASGERPTGPVARVARIWEDVIQAGRVGPDDNFFDVGGTSMHITEVYHRITAEFAAGTDLSMSELFEYATPRRLAERLSGPDPAPRAGRTTRRPPAAASAAAARRRRVYANPVAPEQPGGDQ